MSSCQRDLTKTSNDLARASNDLTKAGHVIAIDSNNLVRASNEYTKAGHVIARDSNKVTEASNEMAKYNGTLGAIMLVSGQKSHPQAKETDVHCAHQLCYTPIALSAGIFSMDAEVVQWLPRTFGSFMALIIGFGVLGFAILRCWPLYPGPWQGCLARTKSLCYGNRARYKATLLETLHFLCRSAFPRRPSATAMHEQLFQFVRHHPARTSESRPAGEDISLPFWSYLVNRQPPVEDPVDAEAQSQQVFPDAQVLSAIRPDVASMRHTSPCGA